MALDELADLGAQARHHFQEIRIDASAATHAEEFEHSQALATKKNRDGKGRAEAVLTGGRLPSKARISR